MHLTFVAGFAIGHIMITGKQVSAGRALLGVSQANLALRSNVGLSTVKSFEKEIGNPRRTNVIKIRDWLISEGVSFAISGDGTTFWVGVKSNDRE